MSIVNIGTEFVWLIVFGGIVSWTKGKSARDQELVNTTTVVEIGQVLQCLLPSIIQYVWIIIKLLDNVLVS